MARRSSSPQMTRFSAFDRSIRIASVRFSHIERSCSALLSGPAAGQPPRSWTRGMRYSSLLDDFGKGKAKLGFDLDTKTSHAFLRVHLVLSKSLIQKSDLRLRQMPTGSPTVLFSSGHVIRFRNGDNIGSRGAPVER